MNIELKIENIYEDAEDVVTTVRATIPAPPEGKEAGSEEYDDWAYDNIYQLTGTGHETGNSAYFVEVTACDDPNLVGAEFEWGL